MPTDRGRAVVRRTAGGDLFGSSGGVECGSLLGGCPSRSRGCCCWLAPILLFADFSFSSCVSRLCCRFLCASAVLVFGGLDSFLFPSWSGGTSSLGRPRCLSCYRASSVLAFSLFSSFAASGCLWPGRWCLRRRDFLLGCRLRLLVRARLLRILCFSLFVPPAALLLISLSSNASCFSSVSCYGILLVLFFLLYLSLVLACCFTYWVFAVFFVCLSF
ncbi:hypothetical protein Tco_0550475 [Tanacetum coccineum]